MSEPVSMDIEKVVGRLYLANESMRMQVAMLQQENAKLLERVGEKPKVPLGG